ncbi:MAG TPA: ABC transporter permease subunit [Candidatus Sulfotelmatobacter sp.]
MNQVLTIARKEIVDGWRDSRSVMASLFYALMGPAVVGLVSMATRANSKPESEASVLTGMMAIFTLVSALVGGMNVAMDTVAGERERRSLLPLLLNPVSRRNVVWGKWLAVSFFALTGLVVDVLGFVLVFLSAGAHISVELARLVPAALGLFSLPFLAASVQMLISTVSRGVKEAQTYLSFIVFLPMGIGMFLVFSPATKRVWCNFLPLVGQQLQLEALMSGQRASLLEPIVLGCLTVGLAIVILLVAANRLQRDEIIYGN